MYTYGNSIKISTRETKFIPLKEGENKFKNKFGNVTQTIELKKVPTVDTGWISDIWKKVQANILREPLVLLKQTILQQKALDLSFNLPP